MGKSRRDEFDTLFNSIMARKPKRIEAPTIPEGAIHVGQTDEGDQPLYLYPKNMLLHLHVAGWSGTGKTNWLKSLIRELVRRKVAARRRGEKGYGFAIIDPHGELAEYALDYLVLFEPELAADTYYMDFRQEAILGLNPLHRWWSDDLSEDAQHERSYFVADLWKEALTKAYGVSGSMDQPTISTFLVKLGQALIANGLSPVHCGYFLYRDKASKGVLDFLSRELSSLGNLRPFWRDHYEKRDDTAQGEAVGPRNRLEPLINPTRTRLMLGAPHDNLDFLRLMDEGDVGIFNLAVSGSHITPDTQNLFASLLMQQFRQSFQRRRENDPEASPPFTLVMDEFGEFCAPSFARAFTAARKYQLEIVFSHQELGQLVSKPDQDDQLLQAVLAVPNKMVFGGLPTDQTEALTKQMWLERLDPERIKHQGYTIGFKPVPVKDMVQSWGTHEAEAEARGEATSEAGGRVESTGSMMVTGPDGGLMHLSNNLGISTAQAHAISHVFSSAQGRSMGLQEAWRTEYEEFVQESSRTYKDVDEQIFEIAKTMNLRPLGHFTFAQYGAGLPVYGHAPHMKQKRVADEDRARFLEEVYRKPEYATVDQAKTRLQAVEDELNARGASAEPEIESSKGPARRKPLRKRRSGR